MPIFLMQKIEIVYLFNNINILLYYIIMAKLFMKTKSCGCVVKVTSVGIKKENDKDLYLIGGHRHIKICEKCKLCYETRQTR